MKTPIRTIQPGAPVSTAPDAGQPACAVARRTRLVPACAAAIAAAVLSVLAACGGSTETPNDAHDADLVMTTFYPVTYMTKRVADGTPIQVNNPLPQGADPIFFRPPPETIQAYQAATLVVANGADFEKWISTAPLPRERLVRSADGFRDRFLTYETVTHSHGPGGEHTHTGVDGHTWLDPSLAVEQARAIAARISETWPEHADTFASNLAELEADFRALDERLAAIDLSGVRLLANHPAYNYLARAHGWEITNLDLDPDSPDAAAMVAELTDVLAGEQRPAVLLWESGPSEQAQSAIASSLNVHHAVFSPAERSPLRDDKSYFDVMDENLQRVSAALDAARASQPGTPQPQDG